MQRPMAPTLDRKRSTVVDPASTVAEPAQWPGQTQAAAAGAAPPAATVVAAALLPGSHLPSGGEGAAEASAGATNAPPPRGADVMSSSAPLAIPPRWLLASLRHARLEPASSGNWARRTAPLDIVSDGRVCSIAGGQAGGAPAGPPAAAGLARVRSGAATATSRVSCYSRLAPLDQ